MKVPERIRTALVLGALLFLAGCSDNGGSDSPSPAPSTTPSSGGTMLASSEASSASITAENPPPDAPNNPPPPPLAAPTPPTEPPPGSGAPPAPPAGPAMGTLSLKLAGVPLGLPEHIYIQVSGVEITGPNGTTTYYYCQDGVSTSPCATPAPKQVDFIALGGSQTITLLDGITLPAGRYGGVRILVDSEGPRDSYIVVQGGAEHEFQLSEQDRARLYVAREFEVPANGHADWIVVFDLRKSIRTNDLGDYVLVPHWRMVDSTQVGSIVMDGGTGGEYCHPVALYVFPGRVKVPDDIDGDDGDPVTTAIREGNQGDNPGYYRASFLEPGEYRIAVACRADRDDPAADDTERLTARGARFVTDTLFDDLISPVITVNAQSETRWDSPFIRIDRDYSKPLFPLIIE